MTDRWDLITFVLDTGATHTSIHPLDATRKLGMSPASLDAKGWASVSPSGGVGGTAYYQAHAASYALFHHEGGVPEVHHGSVEIAELTTHNQDLPSLLGWDVLQFYRLHVDTADVTLERREDNG